MVSKSKDNIATFFLKTLGIKKPHQYQIDLAGRLLFTAVVPHQIFFDRKLSKREIYCLLLAAKGFTISETAGLLKIRKTTVVTHRENIFKKLSCNSIAQAVFEAIRLGYFDGNRDINESS